MDKAAFGKNAEEEASKFLSKNGYKIILRNYKTRYGEIDIIAKDKNCLVFVEVKARTGDEFGSPLEAITKYKLNNLKKTALIFLAKPKIKFAAVRFDVVGIEDGKIQVYKDAITF